MDIAFLLDKYFKDAKNVSIDVFDAQTLNAVYTDIIRAMTSHFEIEVSVLQALSYCLYEMMDNIHIHSGKPLGTAITSYDCDEKALCYMVIGTGEDFSKKREATEPHWIENKGERIFEVTI